MDSSAHQQDDAPQPVPALPAEAYLLVADDTATSRRLLTVVLRKAGAAVQAVDNGQAAVDMVREAQGQQRPFDAILLDIAMPVLDGYATARQLRADGYQGPIVALTAHVRPGERERCLAAGCSDYLDKPVDRATLLTVLARHILAARRGEPAPPQPAQPKSAKSLLESLPAPQRAKLLKDFVDSLLERVAEMEAALCDGDTDCLIQQAHSIHGTAYLFSFPEIAQLAGQIEHGLREGAAPEQFAPAVAQLADLCRAAAFR
jgi:CheY-like chemotaxis protein/HPt (histidine-containing phosphotransfer) domain-containing protein